MITEEQAEAGFFYIEMTEVANTNQECISDFQIAHYRKSEGFQDNYYDAEGMD